jgi:hypothetical protein
MAILVLEGRLLLSAISAVAALATLADLPYALYCLDRAGRGLDGHWSREPRSIPIRLPLLTAVACLLPLSRPCRAGSAQSSGSDPIGGCKNSLGWRC